MLSCLWVPHYAAAVERLHNPALRGVPLLVLSGGRATSRPSGTTASCALPPCRTRPKKISGLQNCPG